ncbi:MAG: antibiotic biosynthesis monooxygenase [Proteobacteria bacterium]|nr:antibiotic biosynthesis monooxygenase [Pseudomonadota bacterium]
MSNHVFVVSEWLPKENCEQELTNQFKKLMALTKENEKGCIRAHVTKQIAHPGAPGKSKYKIVLLQEYINQQAFDIHCASEYVKEFAQRLLLGNEAIIEEWTCRLFSEE